MTFPKYPLRVYSIIDGIERELHYNVCLDALVPIEESGLHYNTSKFEPKEKLKMSTMNYSTAILLTDDNVRAITATYEEHSGAAKTMFKTLDASIKVGDYIVVPTTTRHKMTVVKVAEVDVEIDYDDPTIVEWVVDKVDKATYDAVVAQEQAKMGTIKQIVANKKREQLKAVLFADSADKLKALPAMTVVNE